MSKKVLIMAGGTGGHIFPALAITKELEKREVTVEWLGGNNSMESEFVPGHGIKFHGVYTSGIRGKKFIILLKALFLLSYGFIQTIFVFLKFRPNMVIGMGGFASGLGGEVTSRCL